MQTWADYGWYGVAVIVLLPVTVQSLIRLVRRGVPWTSFHYYVLHIVLSSIKCMV